MAKVLGPCVYVGIAKEALGSQSQINHALAIAVPWGMNQQTENLAIFSPSLSVTPSFNK